RGRHGGGSAVTHGAVNVNATGPGYDLVDQIAEGLLAGHQGVKGRKAEITAAADHAPWLRELRGQIHNQVDIGGPFPGQGSPADVKAAAHFIPAVLATQSLYAPDEPG